MTLRNVISIFLSLSLFSFFLFWWKMIVIVSQRCTFAGVVCFELSCGSTKLSGHVSHLIIPACRRGACGALVPENMTRRRSKERSGPRSFSISAINRNFLLPRCSEQPSNSDLATSFLAV